MRINRETAPTSPALINRYTRREASTIPSSASTFGNFTKLVAKSVGDSHKISPIATAILFPLLYLLCVVTVIGVLYWCHKRDAVSRGKAKAIQHMSLVTPKPSMPSSFEEVIASSKVYLLPAPPIPAYHRSKSRRKRSVGMNHSHSTRSKNSRSTGDRASRTDRNRTMQRIDSKTAVDGSIARLYGKRTHC